MVFNVKVKENRLYIILDSHCQGFEKKIDYIFTNTST